MPGRARRRLADTGVAMPVLNWRRVVVLAGVYMVVACTWSVVVPLFGGPDEPGHFVRSAAVARGQWLGRNAQVTRAGMDYWATLVDLDHRYANANHGPDCFAKLANEPACPFDLGAGDATSTQVYTNVGRYPPASYAVYGLATLLGPRNISVYLARIINALVCSLLFAVALWSIRDRSAFAYVALLVAVPPGTSFISGMINPSGPEMVAAVALWLTTGRLFSSHSAPVDGPATFTRADRLGWAAAAVTLCATRALGPFFAFAIVACTALAGSLDVHTIRCRCQQIRRQMGVAVVVAAGTIVWYLAVFNARAATSVVAGTPSLNFVSRTVRTLGHMPTLVSDMVGNFGWLDTPAPTLVVWTWTTAAAALVIVALSRGTTRLRLAIGATIVGTVVLVVVGEEQANFLARQLWTQGRHIEPLLLGVVLLPVFAASQPLQSVSRHLRPAIILAASLVGISQLHTLRRYTIGLDNYSLAAVVLHPVWQPPATVWTSLLLILFGVGLTIVTWTHAMPPHAHEATVGNSSDLATATGLPEQAA